jgi:hypothetical protein
VDSGGLPVTNAIFVTWAVVAGATSYDLYWTDDGTTPTTASNHIAPGNVTAYWHTGLAWATTYRYKVTVTTAGGTSLISTAMGIATTPAGSGALPGYAPPARLAPKIVLDGLDISKRLGDMPEILEERGMQSDIRFPDSCKIELRNWDKGMSADHPKSIFGKTDWQDRAITIWDRSGLRIWDGILSNVISDHSKRTTTIDSRSTLCRYKDVPVAYTSGAPETPAAALGNIMASIGFTNYDAGELANSAGAQSAILVSVTLAAADKITFSQAIDKLCLLGCADCYQHLDKLRYCAWTDDTPRRTGIVLDEDGIVGDPEITRRYDDVVNDYAIWGGGAVQTDATGYGLASRLRYGSKVLQGVSSSSDTKWVVSTAAGATEIGQRWIRRTHANFSTMPTARWQIIVPIRLHRIAWIDLRTDFGLTYAREGWTAKQFRVVGFTRSDRDRVIKVTALEWGS